MERRNQLLAFGVLFTLFLVLTSVVNAQTGMFKITEHVPNRCATDIIHQRLLVEDVEYQVRHQENEDIMEQAARGLGAPKVGGVYTIPVVVHIIHTGEPVGVGANISDEQIESAIVGMNEDFRRTPGTNGFGAGVDVEVEFCLASRDPQGNPTNGIVRVDGFSVPLYASEGISVGQGDGADEVDTKALSRWPRDDYYNIWIVNEIEDNDGGAGIQGFAYFPNSSASRDGAVILYNAFGTVGNLKSYTSLNRTATHEVGHAFYLYHTFQGGSCTESNCSTQGDRVCDTPPTTSNSNCNSPACSGQQQVENYMDYTYETCMDMFTQGQKDRMRNSIVNLRSGLLSSLGCTPPNTNDAGITSIESPDGFSCNENISPRVELSNFGASNLTSVDIRYRFDGGTLQTFDWTGSIASSANLMVDLPSVTMTPGEHTLEVFTQSPNGSTDPFQSNDGSSVDFEVVSGNVITVGISVDNYGVETTWEIRDDQGDLVTQGGPYPSNMFGTTYEHDICVPEGCYDFTIFDSYGDGIWGGGGFGGYSIDTQDGTNLVTSVPDFTDEETVGFCVEAGGSGPLPSASFQAAVTEGCEGITISFSDQSSGGVTSRSWSFPGGQPSSSTAANPQVTYPSDGVYSVILSVSNANGTDSETLNDGITIGSTPALNAAISHPNCANSTDGSIDVQLSGGTAPFSYSWSNGAGTLDITGLSEGSYSLTVTDALGCSVQGAVSLNAPAPIQLSTSSAQSSCMNDGTASVSAAGGVPPYSVLWSDSQTSSTATDLSGGSYVVVVTDANGCQSSETIEVTSTSDLEIALVESQNVDCFGSESGMVEISVSGGNPSYSIVWSDGQTGNLASGLGAGSVSVTVTDADGCESTQSMMIEEPSELGLEVISILPDSCDLNVGSITLEPFGGVGPYAIEWIDQVGQDGATLTQVRHGDYIAEVTDANLCAAQREATVPELDCIGVTSIDELEVPAFGLYPNPVSQRQITITLESAQERDTPLTLLDITGKIIDQAFIPAGQTRFIWNMDAIHSTGVYLLRADFGKTLATERISVID